jgi:hypothetical protein
LEEDDSETSTTPNPPESERMCFLSCIQRLNQSEVTQPSNDEPTTLSVIPSREGGDNTERDCGELGTSQTSKKGNLTSFGSSARGYEKYVLLNEYITKLKYLRPDKSTEKHVSFNLDLVDALPDEKDGQTFSLLYDSGPYSQDLDKTLYQPWMWEWDWINNQYKYIGLNTSLKRQRQGHYGYFDPYDMDESASHYTNPPQTIQCGSHHSPLHYGDFESADGDWTDWVHPQSLFYPEENHQGGRPVMNSEEPNDYFGYCDHNRQDESLYDYDDDMSNHHTDSDNYDSVAMAWSPRAYIQESAYQPTQSEISWKIHDGEYIDYGYDQLYSPFEEGISMEDQVKDRPRKRFRKRNDHSPTPTRTKKRREMSCGEIRWHSDYLRRMRGQVQQDVDLSCTYTQGDYRKESLVAPDPNTNLCSCYSITKDLADDKSYYIEEGVSNLEDCGRSLYTISPTEQLDITESTSSWCTERGESRRENYASVLLLC